MRAALEGGAGEWGQPWRAGPGRGAAQQGGDGRWPDISTSRQSRLLSGSQPASWLTFTP